MTKTFSIRIYARAPLSVLALAAAIGLLFGFLPAPFYVVLLVSLAFGALIGNLSLCALPAGVSLKPGTRTTTALIAVAATGLGMFVARSLSIPPQAILIYLWPAVGAVSFVVIYILPSRVNQST